MSVLRRRPEIDRVIAAGVRFGTVLADAGYGLSAAFRQGLDARGLTVFPIAGRGRPRQRLVPDQASIHAEDMLAKAIWRMLSWRTGTKGPLKASFAAIRLRVADGAPQRIGDKGQQHMPGEEAWLIGERRISGERKYYLASLPANAALKTLAATIKARWICEQAHQQLKEELGLDHFDGRSWQGLHRHALMTMIAYAYLQHRRLTANKKKNDHGAAGPTDIAGDPTSRGRRSHSCAALPMSALQKATASSHRMNLPKVVLEQS